jgi:peroxiredoxin
MAMICSRLALFCVIAISAGVWGIQNPSAADDYVPPPQAEREAVSALRAKGAIVQVDGNYRVSSVVLLTNCTNDELKLLSACERLVSVQVQSAKITDEGLEHLKAIPKLATVMLSSTSAVTEAGIAALKAASPNVRVTKLSGPGTPPSRTVTATSRPATKGQPAGEVRVEFLPSGMTAKLGGYMPLRAEMKKDASLVQKAPEGLEAANYGALRLGGKTWAFVLDEPDGKPAKLFVDTNGDGDLTNDPPTSWSARTVDRLTQYSGSGKVDLGEGRIGAVNLYRFDPTDARRAELKNTMMFYPDYGYELTMALDGQEFTTAAPPEGSSMPIWIDRDGNNQRSAKRESVRVGTPFNFTGTTYVLNRTGDKFTLEKPSITLPVAPLPPNLAVGQQAVSFETATMDGTKIDFPKSYTGKLVLLDFWATWCGPCIGELPNLKKAYADWHDKGFEVLGISLDSPNMEAKVKSFLQEHDLPWQQVYDGKGPATALADKYEVMSIPFVLLVDGDTGKILATVRDLRGPGLSEFIGKQVASKKP